MARNPTSATNAKSDRAHKGTSHAPGGRPAPSTLVVREVKKRFDGLKRPTFRPASGARRSADGLVRKARKSASQGQHDGGDLASGGRGNPQQLKQRVNQAQDGANRAMEDAKQRADQTAERTKSKWTQMKADAAAGKADVKAKINNRADQLDAKAAAKDTDWVEQDAADAIDYADWMVYDARLSCSTRWTPGPAQTNGPASPAPRSARPSGQACVPGILTAAGRATVAAVNPHRSGPWPVPYARRN
jgi:hypothetical protein